MKDLGDTAGNKILPLFEDDVVEGVAITVSGGQYGDHVISLGSKGYPASCGVTWPVELSPRAPHLSDA